MYYRFNTTIEGAIRTWLLAELVKLNANFKCIWNRPKQPNEPGNRPALPYAAISIIAPPVPLSQTNELEYKSTTIWTHKKTFRFLLQVDIFVDDLLDFGFVDYLAMSKSFISTTDTMAAASLAIQNIGNMQDTTALISNGFEQRATFEIEFLYEKTVDEDIGLIETITRSATLTYEGFGI